MNMFLVSAAVAILIVGVECGYPHYGVETPVIIPKLVHAPVYAKVPTAVSYSYFHSAPAPIIAAKIPVVTKAVVPLAYGHYGPYGHYGGYGHLGHYGGHGGYGFGHY